LQAPVIETERLRLRPWRKDDFRPYHAIISHPAVHAHFGPEPMRAEDCWRRMLAAVGGWQFNGFGTWAVETREGGKLIGSAGLFTAWRALDPEFGEQPEMGWMFAAEAHGKGLASETCRAVLDWAETSLQPTPIWAIISPANQPSFRLAERLGFERLHETAYQDEPTVVLRRAPWR
jgi:RimJ/RimL family protein N-acetyltransferase